MEKRNKLSRDYRLSRFCVSIEQGRQILSPTTGQLFFVVRNRYVADDVRLAYFHRI